MKPQNYLLTILFLTSFLTLFFSKSYAIVPPISINPLADDTICPYLDPNLSLSNFNQGDWTYEWKFVKGTPATYSGISPSVTWMVEGTFLISLIAKEWDEANPPPFNPKSIEYDSIYITIDGTCCLNLPQLTVFSPGQIINQVYQVSQPLILTLPGDYYLDGGSLLFDSKPDIIPGTPGGAVHKNNFMSLGSDVTLDMTNWASLKAHCQEMWYGVDMFSESRIVMDSASILDSYNGLHYVQDQGSLKFRYEITNSIFSNNYQSITIFNNYVDSYITNTLFTCTPGGMKTPFNSGDPNNNGEMFRSFYGFATDQGNSSNIFFDEMQGNTFENMITGIWHWPSAGFARMQVAECHFFNNNISGIHIFGSEDFQVRGCDFKLPLQIDQGFQYQELEQILLYPPIPYTSFLGKVYGIFENNNETDVFITGSEFTTTSEDINEINQANMPRVGIQTFPFDSDLTFQDCQVKNMEYGIVLSKSYTNMFNSSNETGGNLFENNQYSIFMSGGNMSNNMKLDIECNRFSDPHPHSTNHYGIFVENGTLIGDIGGDPTINPNSSPAGNGWPAIDDQAISLGWPTSFSGSGTVTDWVPPANWFSVYDANAASSSSNSSFTYFRYENEFVGDFPNWYNQIISVYPNSVVAPAQGFFGIPQYSSLRTCPQTYAIEFPQRVNINYSKNRDEIKIGLDTVQLMNYQIFNHFGKIMAEGKENNMGAIRRNLQNLPKGLYIIKHFDHEGNLQTSKVYK